MEYLLTLVMTLLLISPLLVIYYRQKHGKNVKTSLITNIAAFFVICILFTGINIGSTAVAAEAESGVSTGLTLGDGIGLIAAAAATGLSCIGGGIAVASSAASALGALSENEKIFGKALIFVAMAEGVALYGMLVSFQILSKIG